MQPSSNRTQGNKLKLHDKDTFFSIDPYRKTRYPPIIAISDQNSWLVSMNVASGIYTRICGHLHLDTCFICNFYLHFRIYNRYMAGVSKKPGEITNRCTMITHHSVKLEWMGFKNLDSPIFFNDPSREKGYPSIYKLAGWFGICGLWHLWHHALYYSWCCHYLYRHGIIYGRYIVMRRGGR